jgi:DNA-directed RNA polymerase II subunit RPB1
MTVDELSRRNSDFKPSTSPLKHVKAIHFGILDPKFIEKYSVCEVTSGVDSDTNSLHPKNGGLSDIRMGPVVVDGKTTIQCATDNLDNQNCPGYFGHVKLARPVYHISFIRTVIRVLSCISYQDSSLLIENEIKNFFATDKSLHQGDRRLRRIFEESRGIRQCPHTGYPQPTYKLLLNETDGIRVMMKFPTVPENDRELFASEAFRILQRISDDDIYALGFDPVSRRPEWMIITVLPIPPPAVRPAVIHDALSRSEDDLTAVLADIVKENKEIRKFDETGVGDHIIQATVSRMQTRIAGYFDNTLPNLERLKQGGRTIKSISERLKGKHGRIRGNLMGKRVDYSARTVITGDASLALDELGVPISISHKLTYPETVTLHNQKWLQDHIIKRRAFKRIVRDMGHEIRSYFKVIGEFKLRLGDTVERHLIDGDVVLFNRQPSLHKMSMMGHRVRILPYSTFRLNLSVTTPYNADFDGDEMNMHVPQTPETRAEIKGLMMVPHNIVSPQRNKPVIGIVQDTLLASSLMTRRDAFIPRSVFMDMCMGLEGWDGKIPMATIIKPRLAWSGKQIFNMLLPRINLRIKSEGTLNGDNPEFSLNDTHVNITNGELLTGILCKRTLGPSAGGLIHVSSMEYGPETTSLCITNIQMCVTYWLLHNGMSIGIGDATTDKFTMKKIKEVILDQKNEVERIVRRYQAREIEADPGLTVIETFEKAVNQVLNKARESAGKAVQQSLRDDNNMKRMVMAGSKGNKNNISQVMACLAQQNVEGRRIKFGFEERSLPHFVKGDYGPRSKGFVENSYLSGLEPQELFFHAMGGREGLIDTAIKTADSGYIQRKLVKALEDLMVRYDGTVRNSDDDIVQFLYGEDGLDGACVEAQKLDYIQMTVSELEDTYRYDFHKPTSSFRKWLCPKQFDMFHTETSQNKLEREYEIILDLLRELREGLIFPEQAGLNPITVVERTEELLRKLIVVPGNERLTVEAQSNATIMFHNLVRSTLASKRVLREYKLTPEAFEWLLVEIENRFHLSQVNPGEMIGTIAAQSLGEPTTQMTLNTFHSAGIGTKNVTFGVPRMKEILNVTSDIETPSLTVYLREDVATSQLQTKKVASSIEYTVLGKLLRSVQIWYDPDLLTTVITEDQFLLDIYSLELRDDEPADFAPWVLRMELDKVMCLDKEMMTKDVADNLEKNIAGLARVLYSPLNADVQVIRIRFSFGDDDIDEMMRLAQYEDSAKLFPTFFLKGVKQIHRAMISKTKKTVLRSKHINMTHPVANRCIDWPEFETIDESWVIHTEGTNMRDVMSFSDEINHKEIYSNNLVEVVQTLGIEASRAVLFLELKRVIEFDGSSVNYRHLAILVEIMTFRGFIVPVSRHGINRHGLKPLARCTFEEPIEILTSAAVFADKDSLAGVSDKIIMGQLAMLGTASFDMVLNEVPLDQATHADIHRHNNGLKLHEGLPSVLFQGNNMIGSGISGLYHSTFGSLLRGSNNVSFSTIGGRVSSANPHVAMGQIQKPTYSLRPATHSLTATTYLSATPTYMPTSASEKLMSLCSTTMPTYTLTRPLYSAKFPVCSPTSPVYSPNSHWHSSTSRTYSLGLPSATGDKVA